MSRWPLEWRWRAGRLRTIVGMDATGLAWQCRGSAPRSATLTTEAALLTQHLGRRARVDIIVSNDLAVHWLQMPPAGVQSLGELRQVAAARCAQLFGGTPGDWWVAGDWNATHAFVCAGLPKERTAPLQHALGKAGATSRWHTVWGMLCHTQARLIPADGWSALRSASHVVVWHCRRGRVTALHSMNLGTQASAAQAHETVAQLLRIEAWRDPALPPGPVHWAQLPAPTPALASQGAAIALALAAWLPGVVR